MDIKRWDACKAGMPMDAKGSVAGQEPGGSNINIHPPGIYDHTFGN